MLSLLLKSYLFVFIYMIRLTVCLIIGLFFIFKNQNPSYYEKEPVYKRPLTISSHDISAIAGMMMSTH